MSENDYYRFKAEELVIRLKQIKSVVLKHNLTIGQIAEAILRTFLKEILPQKVKIVQGFICKDNQISTQCDIIIYDCLNYSPLYMWDDLVVIESKAVIAVIEVKVSLREKEFVKTMKDFELLRVLGVTNKFLFIYNAPLIKTLKYYFFSQPIDINDDPIFADSSKYDYDNFENLPDAIIGLSRTYFLQKGYIDTGRDMLGYHSFVWIDEESKEISCLEEFISVLLNIIGEYSNTSNLPMSMKRIESEITAVDISKCDFIPLFNM